MHFWNIKITPQCGKHACTSARLEAEKIDRSCKRLDGGERYNSSIKWVVGVRLERTGGGESLDVFVLV